MTEDQVVSLLVQGGIGATALAMLGKITMKVAERMIAAIDALTKEARDTGKATVDALSSLTERLSRLEGKVEVLSADRPQEQAINRERARSPVAEELADASLVTRRR
jgi:TolA-binding protein